MRALSFYIFALAVFLVSAKASVAAPFVAPVPVGVGGQTASPSVVPAAEPVIAEPVATPFARQGETAAPVAAAEKAPAPSAPAPVIAAEEPVVEEVAAPQPAEQAAPEPEAAASEVPASFGSLEVAPTVAKPAVGAMSLQRVLLEAYKNNPRIKAERERQKSTDEQVAEAISGFRPSANATYEKGRQRTSSFGGADRYGDTMNKNLRIEQPLFRGGGTVAGYQAAKQRVKAGQYRLMAVEQQVLFETITAYMDTVQAQSILAIARNNEDVLRQQLKASQDRFDVGEVTRTDVAQSEARLSNASAQVINAEGDLIAAIADLENLIGMKPESALASPASLPVVPASLRESMQIAQNANPDLLQSVHVEKASKYDIRRNVASILPQVSLVGSMGRQEGIGAFGATEFDQDALMLNVSIPLYQSGAEYARVRAAKATRSQRKFEEMNTRLTVDSVVTQSWEALETSIATIDARRDQIKAAEVALDGVKQEQEYGARTVLDVLDAEQELFVARSNLVRAERDRVVAVFGLLQALGQLTPETLELGVSSYDPQENLDRVKWLPIGF